MIKPSFIFVLFGILVAMALAFLLTRGDRPIVNPPEDGGKQLIVPFDITTAEAITIKKGDVTIKLECKDKKWTMASLKNRPVKTERVDMLMSNLNMARVEDKRSGEPSAFDLDEKGGTLVTIDRGSARTEVMLGKTFEPLHSFVRGENGKVLVVNKSLDTDAGIRLEDKEKRVLDPSYFYDLNALNINADDVIDIAIKKGHDIIRIQKVIPGKGPLQPRQEAAKDDPKPVWWITEPDAGAVDDGAIARLVAMTHFPAKAYADTVPEKDRGFDKPAAKVKVRVKDGSEFGLIFGKVDPAEVIVQVEGRPDPYKIDKYIYDALTQDLGELKKKDADAPAPRSQGDGFPPGPPPHPIAQPHPGVGPESFPDGTKLTPEQIEAIKQKIRPPIVIPHNVPPPPPEQKPALPPAVIKQPDEKPKPEEKK